jgi:hypothetical protein
VQINGNSPDSGTVVEVRGKKSMREGNDTPEQEKRTKKMKRTPTSQNKNTSQCNSSPKRRLTPTRHKTPQKRTNPHRRKTPQKKTASGGNEKETMMKKGRVFLFEGKEYNTYSEMVQVTGKLDTVLPTTTCISFIIINVFYFVNMIIK